MQGGLRPFGVDEVPERLLDAQAAVAVDRPAVGERALVALERAGDGVGGEDVLRDRARLAGVDVAPAGQNDGGAQDRRAGECEPEQCEEAAAHALMVPTPGGGR